jgi:FG-GAP-like repeat/Bacterial Ig-like domain/Secretion system C-terminal sorting domain
MNHALLVAFVLHLARIVPAFALASPVVPQVLTVQPSANITVADPNGPIVVDFSSPMDPQTFNSSTVMVFGHWSGVAPGQFQFENGHTRMRFVPTRPLSAGELVTVTLSRNVTDTNGVGLLHGYAWTFWVKTQPGTMDYQEIDRIPIRRTGENHIQTYGAYGGDMNGDGFLDITVVNEISHDVRVFLNDSSGNYGQFTVYPIPTGNTPSPNEGADFNGDGILDYAVGNAGNDSLTVFLGDGSGGFSALHNFHAATAVRSVAILDFDGDGKMDVATANRTGNNVSLFHGLGDGTFASSVNIEGNGNQETAIAAADANGDGIMDLFVGSLISSQMSLLLGDGDGGFALSQSVSTGSRPWMIAVGDVNGDRNVDVVSANSSGSSASVILGDGLGGLQPAVNYPAGDFPLAIDLGDIDGDGDLDLVVSSYLGHDWSVYENNGSGTFINLRTLQASSAGSCATLYDRDNDGDLDFAGIDEVDDLLFIFDNRPTAGIGGTRIFSESSMLKQNYPNPFNPSTRIDFEVAEAGPVTLHLYDAVGRELRTLVDESFIPGAHQMVLDGAGLASGVYFYRLTTAHSSLVRKLVVMK